MTSKSILLLLPLLVAAISLCKGELVPVSKYIGKHQYKCSYGLRITGAQVENKLYTFGGCYPIPYFVDPLAESADDPYGMAGMMGMDKKLNVSSSIQVYDMIKDEWTVESTAKLPSPWSRASLQVVNRDVYAYYINARPESSQVAFWKFSTVEKTWTQLDDLPFIWSGILTSCQRNGKIYFSGSEDGNFRNIVHVYDVTQGQWEKDSIFLDKKIYRITNMLCGKDFIQFVGKERKFFDEEQAFWYSSDDFNNNDVKKTTHGVFRAAYDSGITTHNHNITGNFLAMVDKNDSLYLYDVGRENSTIVKLDSNTFENVTLGTFPYILEKPLLVPYQDDQVFLFGGGKRKRYLRSHNKKTVEGVNTIKTYSHKLISTDGDNIKDMTDKEAVAFEEKNSPAKLVLQDQE